ncbi:MAG: hypothetical protein ACREL9_11705, partial [Gemmatimonadales bacterium]
MLDPRTFAARFARVLDLFRDPQAKEARKAEFRALISLLHADAATVRAGGGRVVVNEAMLEGTDVVALLQRLELHGVGEIVIPADPRPGDLFALLTALADQPGEDDVPTRLRAMGAERITVAILHLYPPPESPPPPPRRRTEHDVGGILRGDPMGDIASPVVPVEGMEFSQAPIPPPTLPPLPSL